MKRCGPLHLDGRIMLPEDVLEDAVLVLETSVHPGGHRPGGHRRQARGCSAPATSASVKPPRPAPSSGPGMWRNALQPNLGSRKQQGLLLELDSPQPRSAAVDAKAQRFCGVAQWNDARKLALRTERSPRGLQQPASGTPAARVSKPLEEHSKRPSSEPRREKIA